jgi:hypothetical protein
MSLDIKLECAATVLFPRGQDLVKRQRCERSGVAGYRVGNDEPPTIHEATTRVNDIWYAALALAYFWLDQWFRQAASIRSFCKGVTGSKIRPDKTDSSVNCTVQLVRAGSRGRSRP